MSKIRRAARGRQCTVRLAGVCDGGGETTVLAHENSLAAGKGMGTPTFYINGREISGAQPLDAFTKMIDEELAKKVAK